MTPMYVARSHPLLRSLNIEGGVSARRLAIQIWAQGELRGDPLCLTQIGMQDCRRAKKRGTAERGSTVLRYHNEEQARWREQR